MADAIAIFRKDDVPSRRWGEKTALSYDQILRRIERERGTHECAAFSVRECAAYVREATESARGRQQLRLVLAGDNPPTFHEVRSLGIAMLREQGWKDDQIQQLAAHSDVAMTTHYLEGHEAPWTDVKPGLSLRQQWIDNPDSSNV